MATEIDAPRGPGPAERLAAILAIAAALLAGFWALLPDLFADPFARNDDYPALLARPELFEWRTLANGRWLNWVWMHRAWPTGIETQWLMHMGLWCLTAAALGAAIFRRDRWPLRAALAAAAIAAMPQMALMSGWFGQTIPSDAILAAVAVGLALRPAGGTGIWVGAAVAAAVMTHTTWPMLIAVAAGLSAEPRQGEDHGRAALRLAVALTAGFSIGVLTVFALNWAVWDVFGLVVADWRATETPRSLAEIVQNLDRARAWLWETLVTQAVTPVFAALSLGFAGLAAVVVAGRAPGRFLLAATGIGWAVALGSALVVYSGTPVPFRAAGAIWLGIVGLWAVAAARAPGPIGVLFLVLAAGATVGGAAIWRGYTAYSFLPPQAATRALAERIAAAGPADEVLIRGQVHGLSGLENVQSAVGVEFRLEGLLDTEVRLCTQQTVDALHFGVIDPTILAGTNERANGMEGWIAKARADHRRCEAASGALDRLAPWPSEGALGRIGPSRLGVRLPERRLGDEPP
ncbi:MAG: hypothetical protein ACFBSD_11650 [Paracoccaceae bacterium]